MRNAEKGTKHLEEQYADDLTIFFEFNKDDDDENFKKIKKYIV